MHVSAAMQVIPEDRTVEPVAAGGGLGLEVRLPDWQQPNLDHMEEAPSKPMRKRLIDVGLHVITPENYAEHCVTMAAKNKPRNACPPADERTTVAC